MLNCYLDPGSPLQPPSNSGNGGWNTHPPKCAPANPSFFTLRIHSEATRPIVPEDNTNLNGSTADPQAPYRPQGSLVRGKPCFNQKHCSLKPCSCVYFSDNKLKLGAADSNPAVFWDTGEGRSPQHKQTNKASQQSTATACGSDAWEKYEWKKYSAVRSRKEELHL
ncbi:UNVERIFIED_CONTAM: hypothetical protein FKN15_033631 [Acipenser sinensis]